MELSLDQIRSIARGVARVEQHNGAIRLLRFTMEQQRMYQFRNPDFYEKTFATAGINLCFDTDSTHLGLAVRVSRGSENPVFHHSLLVNGKPAGHVHGFLDNESMECHKTFDLEPGMKRVQIWFPWSVASELKALALDDGAVAVPVPTKRRILMFGDSITQGYDARFPENAYACRLAAALDVDAVNKGIGGEIFCPELAALSDDFHPELITVAYGTNDWCVCRKEELEANCIGFFENLRKTYPDVPICALTPIWRENMELTQLAGDFSYVASLITQATRRVGGSVIDGIGLVPADIRLFTDGLHPHDEGFRYYAERLIQKIK